MRPRLSSQDRTLAAAAALGIVAIAMVMAVTLFLQFEEQRIATEQHVTGVLWDGIGRLDTAVRDQRTAVAEHLRAPSGVTTTRYQTAVADEVRLVAELRRAAANEPVMGVLLTSLTDATGTWRAAVGSPAMRTSGGTPESPALDPGRVGEATVDRALAALHDELRSMEASLEQSGEQLITLRYVVLGFQGVGGLIAMALALYLVRRYSDAVEEDTDRAQVLNRFTEYASFAQTEDAIASSNLQALSLLVHPDAAVTHILNRSQDRAVPEATLGQPIAEVLALNALSHCPGVARGSTYVTSDASLPLSVRCPVYPIEQGTLACIPLNSGEQVGSIHLFWSRPESFPLEERLGVARIAEHAALAIGNRRLLAALQGQATTDPRTGLANSRSFDLAAERELRAADDQRPVGVLMLDLDHFKDFNDHHGHPAGDEALRAFAGVLRSCLREQDLAARYGGEEFAVLLPGSDAQGSRAVAERIRARTEATLIALAPGMTARITVSIGVAVAPEDGTQRVELLHVADEALYQAKNSGRNRVMRLVDVVASVPAAGSVSVLPSARRRPRSASAVESTRAG